MTGLTFGGARMWSDRDMEECEEMAEGSSHALDIYADCMEGRWLDALKQEHDEWWADSGPEDWEIYGHPDVAWPKAA